MKILFIETAINLGAIKVVDGKNSYPLMLIDKHKPSNELMLDINNYLESASLTLKDLTAIFSGLGPGSFLGARNGLITAKALSFGLDIPLYGTSSMSFYTPQEPGKYYVITDAKSKGVYVLEGDEQHGFSKTPFLCDLSNLSTLDHKAKWITPDQTLISKDPLFREYLEIVSIHPECLEELVVKNTLTKNEPTPLEIHYLRLS